MSPDDRLVRCVECLEMVEGVDSHEHCGDCAEGREAREAAEAAEVELARCPIFNAAVDAHNDDAIAHQCAAEEAAARALVGCDACGATGLRAHAPCPDCRGRGYLPAAPRAA